MLAPVKLHGVYSSRPGAGERLSYRHMVQTADASGINRGSATNPNRRAPGVAPAGSHGGAYGRAIPLELVLKFLIASWQAVR